MTSFMSNYIFLKYCWVGKLKNKHQQQQDDNLHLWQWRIAWEVELNVISFFWLSTLSGALMLFLENRGCMFVVEFNINYDKQSIIIPKEVFHLDYIKGCGV